MSERDDLVLLKKAVGDIDVATTAAGTATLTLKTNLDGILAALAEGVANGADVSALVTQAQGEVSKLSPIVDSLNAMAQSTTTPVPVPVPTPAPVEPAAP